MVSVPRWTLGKWVSLLTWSQWQNCMRRKRGIKPQIATWRTLMRTIIFCYWLIDWFWKLCRWAIVIFLHMHDFDSLLLMPFSHSFILLDFKEFHFIDCGDWVAQLLHLALVFPFSQCQNCGIRQEILNVNTPTISSCFQSMPCAVASCLHKILQHVDFHLNEYQFKPLPIILCGVWSGSW